MKIELTELLKKITPLPYAVDDGMICMKQQAECLIENAGTDQEWSAIGITDEGCVAEVIALAHKYNAAYIAHAATVLPKTLEALRRASAAIEEARTIILCNDLVDVLEQDHAAIESAIKKASTVEVA